MSMRRPLMLLAVGGLAALGAAVAAGALWFERPAHLSVAVARMDEPDRALIESAARLLRRTRNAARLQLQVVDDAAAASEAVDAHRADLAVIRTDVAIPGDAQTVVILHRDSAVLMAPASSGLKGIADLPGHTLGVVRLGAGNRGLITTVLSEADLKPDSVTLVELSPEEVGEALRSKRVAAVMAVDVISSSALRDVVRSVSTVDPPVTAAVPAPPPAKPTGRDRTKPTPTGIASAKTSGRDKGAAALAGGRGAALKPGKAEDDDGDDDKTEPAKNTLAFIPIAEAEAIAQRSPAYEKSEVVRGMFGGTPPRPAKDYDTLSVTHRLVANENVSQDLVAGLTRFFLTEKGPIAASAPIALHIEAPSTDKGASLPVHAGSAAYIDDDEQTFFDKYSDIIYIGAMLIGVLASGVTAVMGRLTATRSSATEGATRRLLDVMGAARVASSAAELDTLQEEADRLMAQALDVPSSSGGDRRLVAFGLALDQVRAAVRDRRVQLGPSPTAAEVLGLAAE